MPDVEKVNECVSLSHILWFLPAPARAQMADSLYELGVRVHPELATKEIIESGPEGMRGHRPRQLVDIKSKDHALNALKGLQPELFRQVQNVGSEDERLALLAEIEKKYPTVIADARRRISDAPQDGAG